MFTKATFCFVLMINGILKLFKLKKRRKCIDIQRDLFINFQGQRCINKSGKSIHKGFKGTFSFNSVQQYITNLCDR